MLTERLEPGELGAEPLEASGGRDATEVEMLPSLPAAEYESAGRAKRAGVNHTGPPRVKRRYASRQAYSSCSLRVNR